MRHVCVTLLALSPLLAHAQPKVEETKLDAKLPTPADLSGLWSVDLPRTSPNQLVPPGKMFMQKDRFLIYQYGADGSLSRVPSTVIPKDWLSAKPDYAGGTVQGFNVRQLTGITGTTPQTEDSLQKALAAQQVLNRALAASIKSLEQSVIAMQAQALRLAEDLRMQAQATDARIKALESKAGSKQ